MTEEQCLADKILQELPEELAAATRFKEDEKGNLCMFFDFKLAGPDFPIVLDVVKRYNGDFVNKKEGGKDVGYFMLPKPKPATVEAKTEVPKPEDPVPVAAQAAEVSQEKSLEVPKQPSPVAYFFESNCRVCEDSPKCIVSTEEGRFHRAMCLQLLNLQQMQVLNANLEKFRKVAVSQPAQAASPVVAAPPSQKVERNTRPTEGHKEGDVVWIYAENQGGERYEKALQKDNDRSNGYFDIRGKIQTAEKASEKGVVIEGKWCWLSKQGDYIGRKPAKEFPRGGGH
jgi:hypothetical protein